MTYQELRNKQQQEVNDFPFGFAFDKEQFEQMLEKNHWKKEDVVSFMAGSYLLRKDVPAMKAMFQRHHEELNELKKQRKERVKAFIYEMANHEFNLTYDDQEVLSCFNLTLKALNKDKELKTDYLKAKKQYLKECEA